MVLPSEVLHIADIFKFASQMFWRQPLAIVEHDKNAIGFIEKHFEMVTIGISHNVVEHTGVNDVEQQTTRTIERHFLNISAVTFIAMFPSATKYWIDSQKSKQTKNC